jgi:lipopolysaccharide/colanic/teichoic acid biosynthesis glycosyltransferase
MLKKLVESWKDPSIAIEGITQLSPGVWGTDPRQLNSTTHVVSPIWMGFGSDQCKERVVVGPYAIQDVPTSAVEKTVKLLNIDEVWSSSNRVERQGPVQDITTYQLIKRLIDILVSLAILIIVSPILLVVAIAVAMDNGFPLLFGHTRQTLGGRDFRCWKFRTMMKDAESMVHDLQSENLADGPQVFIKDDPRITRLGRMLRRFHLDELPQFWNVLVGDMSLVGPRPSPDKENQFCPAWRESRLSVRPGITGLWQVERTRAPGLDFQEWIRYDIEYVNRASLLLDAKICLKTLYRIVSG